MSSNGIHNLGKTACAGWNAYFLRRGYPWSAFYASRIQGRQVHDVHHLHSRPTHVQFRQVVYRDRSIVQMPAVAGLPMNAHRPYLADVPVSLIVPEIDLCGYPGGAVKCSGDIIYGAESFHHARFLMGREGILRPLGQLCLILGLLAPVMRRILARTFASLVDFS